MKKEDAMLVRKKIWKIIVVVLCINLILYALISLLSIHKIVSNHESINVHSKDISGSLELAKYWVEYLTPMRSEEIFLGSENANFLGIDEIGGLGLRSHIEECVDLRFYEFYSVSDNGYSIRIYSTSQKGVDALKDRIFECVWSLRVNFID